MIQDQEQTQGSVNVNLQENFYRRYAKQFSELTETYYRTPFLASTHPLLRDTASIHQRLKELVPGNRGLDAGCGAAARDVYKLLVDGYQMFGIDVSMENLDVARELRPEIGNRLFCHDLCADLPFADDSFDFVMCNAVIQHIDRQKVHNRVLPQISRVLRARGILQLLFKRGAGTQAVLDKEYGVHREFTLYEAQELLPTLEDYNLRLIEPNNGEMAGILHYTDYRYIENTVIFLIKDI